MLLALVWMLLVSTAHASWKEEILYFVMLDRFADGDTTNNQGVDVRNPLAFHGGDLKGLTEQLDYVHELGATAIWLTPINQQINGSITVEGKEFFPHHGYWAENYYAIDPRFGSEADLKELVEKAHGLGMKVILDVVYNHVGYGANFLQQYPHWVRTNEQCGGDSISQCLSGLPDLRTEMPEVQDYLFEAHLGLAERTDIDGFRLDTVKHISHEFWQQHRSKAKARLGDDFLLLGEIWGADKYTARRYFEQNELDGVFDFGFREQTLRFFNAIGSAKRYGRYLAKRHLVADGYLLAPFLSNHDMPTLLAMFGGDEEKFLAAATILFCLEGMPVIAWGEEHARQGKAWPHNRQNMYWAEPDYPPGADWVANSMVLDKFKQLIALRKTHPDLTSAYHQLLFASQDLLVLQRGEGTLLIVNRGNEASNWPVELGDHQVWKQVFSSLATSADIPYVIAPKAAHMYVLR